MAGRTDSSRSDDPVSAAVDLLYGDSPDSFVETRKELARQAKEAGRRAEAKEIAALRKPTVAAFAVNLLVRSRRDEVASFVELGEALREATATMSGPELRDLSRQRHQVVLALVRQARELCLEHGHRIGEDVLRAVEETLNGALTSSGAADSVLSGRLTAPLAVTGFAPTEAPANPPPAPPTKKRAARKAPGEDERAALEKELAAAWAAARKAADTRDTAARELDQAQAGLAETEREVTRLSREVDRLRAELAEQEEQLEEAESDQSSAAEDAKVAKERHRSAERDATSARARVTDLQTRLDGA